ncbi:Protein of unknown function [Pyronema omphalodes CBS 100304]|uniref:Uncharacterized protein n=1 Tax=Pyronema omphalodes (strain CBS 100304) TaxID=1076935 RepID=U4L9J0_PYROM|nr:Protein of unknown function [Pyronema omphalodes CBS 100304]
MSDLPTIPTFCDVAAGELRESSGTPDNHGPHAPGELPNIGRLTHAVSKSRGTL